ncbi:MAG: hypothetical protein E5V58_12875 [Mesorhizobium sp.]|uniref:hypothetical protein n=1 Tax=Mesorhizobium sp. TaxID=1871066 RepID=UPI000FE4F7CF|nr:hypothetical protein [Mesorhizobium sp.]RWC90179.1 MAG: hypothetical protein EOS32_28635 [Mesorhizobium sp.]TIW72962.1 MAG: hypothetical protein E5V58_12875 [Mesorhizobium sp.]
MFTKTNTSNLAGAVIVLAAIAGAGALTSGAHAGDFKVKHGIAHAVTQGGGVNVHGRPAPSPGGFKAASRLPSLVDRVQPRIDAKIDCVPNGCKSGPPDLYKHKKLPCELFGCKPDHGHHHGHHKHGAWGWGGVTIVASDHGGCGYEFWKWKVTGWRFWKHAYLACRDWE